MQGYRTEQQRKEHLAALAHELEGIKQEIKLVKARQVDEDQKVELAKKEERLADLTKRGEEVQKQLRVFKGAAPQKRAEKRKA